MQLSYNTRECPREAGVGEVEDVEEREVTEVRGERSLEGNARQLQGGDALPAAAARHADPLAEAGCIVLPPAITQEAQRVRDPSLEGKQRGEVGTIALLIRHDRRREQRRDDDGQYY